MESHNCLDGVGKSPSWWCDKIGRAGCLRFAHMPVRVLTVHLRCAYGVLTVVVCVLIVC